jgi:signal transduction histidine kinase
MTPMFAEKQRRARTDAAAEQPRAIAGDRDRLTQVIINLLSNAWKFAPENTGRVRVTP